MDGQPRIVDLADRRTWPPAFGKLVRKVAEGGRLEQRALAGQIEDLPFVDALGGALLRTYHRTRLTDTEVAWVREEGLHPPSAALAERKIDQAVADGHLADELGQLYRASHMCRERNRNGRLCLVGDRVDLASPFQVGWLLSLWGGEAINHAFSTRSAESRRLERVGTPTVVVALLEPATECSYAHPGIGQAAGRGGAGHVGEHDGHARAGAHRGGPPAGLPVLGPLRASRRHVSHGSLSRRGRLDALSEQADPPLDGTKRPRWARISRARSAGFVDTDPHGLSGSSWTDVACGRGRLPGGWDIVPHACPLLPVAGVPTRLTARRVSP